MGRQLNVALSYLIVGNLGEVISAPDAHSGCSDLGMAGQVREYHDRSKGGWMIFRVSRGLAGSMSTITDFGPF